MFLIHMNKSSHFETENQPITLTELITHLKMMNSDASVLERSIRWKNMKVQLGDQSLFGFLHGLKVRP